MLWNLFPESSSPLTPPCLSSIVSCKVIKQLVSYQNGVKSLPRTKCPSRSYQVSTFLLSEPEVSTEISVSRDLLFQQSNWQRQGTNDDTGEIKVPSWSSKSFKNLKMESKRRLGANLLEYRRKITGQARYKSSHPSGGEQRKEREKAMLFELKIAWRSVTWWTSSLVAGRETLQWEWKGPRHQSNQTGSGQHFKEREWRKDTPIGRQIQQSLMVAYRDYKKGNNSWREKYIIPLMGHLLLWSLEYDLKWTHLPKSGPSGK